MIEIKNNKMGDFILREGLIILLVVDLLVDDRYGMGFTEILTYLHISGVSELSAYDWIYVSHNWAQFTLKIIFRHFDV